MVVVVVVMVVVVVVMMMILMEKQGVSRDGEGGGNEGMVVVVRPW